MCRISIDLVSRIIGDSSETCDSIGRSTESSLIRPGSDSTSCCRTVGSCVCMKPEIFSCHSSRIIRRRSSDDSIHRKCGIIRRIRISWIRDTYIECHARSTCSKSRDDGDTDSIISEWSSDIRRFCTGNSCSHLGATGPFIIHKCARWASYTGRYSKDNCMDSARRCISHIGHGDRHLRCE